MQKLNFNINGKHYEATITEVEHNVAEVELNGKKYTIDVERSEAVAIPHNRYSQACSSCCSRCSRSRSS